MRPFFIPRWKGYMVQKIFFRYTQTEESSLRRRIPVVTESVITIVANTVISDPSVFFIVPILYHADF